MSDTTARLFEPDTLMPEQFFGTNGKARGAANERQLMLAILRDAVECHQRYARSRDYRTREIFQEADEWIFSRERDWPFSFENICDALGVDPEYVRSGVSGGRSLQAEARLRRKSRRTAKIVSVLPPATGFDRLAEPFDEACLPKAS